MPFLLLRLQVRVQHPDRYLGKHDDEDAMPAPHTPALKKIKTATHISARDTRASYITNALDRNERMSFIQKQVGHTTTRMIVDHYYRHVPAPDDGNRLEDAWNSTSILPVSKDADLQVSEKTG
jgi:integrase